MRWALSLAEHAPSCSLCRNSQVSFLPNSSFHSLLGPGLFFVVFPGSPTALHEDFCETAQTTDTCYDPVGPHHSATVCPLVMTAFEARLSEGVRGSCLAHTQVKGLRNKSGCISMAQRGAGG